MIVVDSSVWIGNLRNTASDAVRKLRRLDAAQDEILVGDLVLMEVLMGAPDEAAAVLIHEALRQFSVVALAGPEIAAEAARNYRILRRLGTTVRSGIGLLIGTFCIRFGHTLLHDDRDFTPMQRHLGLSVL